MKKIIFTVMLLQLILTASYGQNTPQCCQMKKQPVNGMVAFASDPTFISAHESPLPFDYQAQAGKMVLFPTPDGKTAHAYEIKSTTPTNNVLLIFHEWWGLNDYIKQRADELQKSLGNVDVLAIDIYDGKVAFSPDSASKYMSGLTDARTESIIKGVVTYAGKNARIVTLGWCMGGGLSLRGALAGGKQTIGCVMYYGMPSKDVIELKKLHGDVLGLFAGKDQWITPAVVKQFQDDMKTAGKTLTVKSYDADHAFANPSNPHYDIEASADANGISLDFLKKHFAVK